MFLRVVAVEVVGSMLEAGNHFASAASAGLVVNTGSHLLAVEMDTVAVVAEDTEIDCFRTAVGMAVAARTLSTEAAHQREGKASAARCRLGCSIPALPCLS